MTILASAQLWAHRDRPIHPSQIHNQPPECLAFLAHIFASLPCVDGNLYSLFSLVSRQGLRLFVCAELKSSRRSRGYRPRRLLGQVLTCSCMRNPSRLFFTHLLPSSRTSALSILTRTPSLLLSRPGLLSTTSSIPTHRHHARFPSFQSSHRDLHGLLGRRFSFDRGWDPGAAYVCTYAILLEKHLRSSRLLERCQAFFPLPYSVGTLHICRVFFTVGVLPCTMHIAIVYKFRHLDRSVRLSNAPLHELPVRIHSTA